MSLIPGIGIIQFKAKSGGAFFISSLSLDKTKDLSGSIVNTVDIRFSSDGTKFYVLEEDGDVIYHLHRYTLSTAWDITTASYHSGRNLADDGVDYAKSFIFSSDGAKLYVLASNYNNDYIVVHEYTPSSTWAITGSKIWQTGEITDISSSSSICINPTGTKLFIDGGSDNSVLSYPLSTAYNLSTIGYPESCSVDRHTYSIWIDSTGKHLYTVDGSFNLYRHSLNTAWSMSYNNATQVEAKLSMYPIRKFIFSTDGTKGYISASGGSTIYQYKI